MKRTKEHSTNRKGDLAEFYAVTWLWDNGYEVFKNCGCDGFIDLVDFYSYRHIPHGIGGNCVFRKVDSMAMEYHCSRIIGSALFR